MSQHSSSRLPDGGRINRQRPLRFTFDGQAYTGFEGDTLASALLASGVSCIARSWKYHRPRGLLAAGVEEPNGLVQLFEGARTVPNARMTEVLLSEGLVARSIHASPSLRFDWRAINGLMARLIPAGFYYKTFMASQRAWHFFEKHIRKASGLGASPMQADPDVYDKQFAHVDVLVVGGGVAGLSAALAASRSGKRVMLCDEQAELGGWLLSSDEQINGMPAVAWLAQTLQSLKEQPDVVMLPRTTAFGYQDHNLVTLIERKNDHLPAAERRGYRERLWRVRARQVILATGAHERPLVFANNDLPGVMLANAATTYTRRYGINLASNALVFTNNDSAYETALALQAAGATVRVIDARAQPQGPWTQRAQAAGIAIMAGHVVAQAAGGMHVQTAWVQAIDAQGRLAGQAQKLACELLAVSGGFSPVIHLHAQAGSKAIWSDAQTAFLPGVSAQGESSAGACRGHFDLAQAAADGEACGAGSPQAAPGAPHLQALWLVPHSLPASRAPKQFVDFQNDVSAADLLLATREGFESIEHVKRYTALGFGTDQGKTGNINGMGIVAQALGKTIPQVGTTTFRPNYTPVTFGALAGLELGDTFDPIRITPMHAWHVLHGATFEDVGQWKRAWYFPNNGEDLHAAVKREVLAVRNSVGTLDASTLGKIDIQGPDAATLLNWVYTNAWSKLEVGKCRYGVMLDENGMVFDDGVTVRLAENHFLMHTTTGGAARVLAWLERWLQTEWPHLKVYLTSVTDHWATTAVVGPKSRAVLQKICSNVDFDDAAFPFMSWREGTLSVAGAGIKARIMRISFSGERSYEVNVPSEHGLKVWQAIHEAGEEFGITPYGTETMHVLRAEKGFIIVGQDTDGSVTPIDLGMQGMVAKTKDFLGRRSLSRADTVRPDRKQLVGLLTQDPQRVLPEGAQILEADPATLPAGQLVPMGGHVTSSYMSPTLSRSIAMALVQRGHARMGDTVRVGMRDGSSALATVVSPVFLDPEGARQNA
jgi:sarcosine oxidase, subunit alpha